MGTFKGYTIDEVFGELLKGSAFEKKEIIISEIANLELWQIRWYISQDSKFYAEKTLSEI